jgi:hypothetical protein
MSFRPTTVLGMEGSADDVAPVDASAHQNLSRWSLESGWYIQKLVASRSDMLPCDSGDEALQFRVLCFLVFPSLLVPQRVRLPLFPFGLPRRLVAKADALSGMVNIGLLLLLLLEVASG